MVDVQTFANVEMIVRRRLAKESTRQEIDNSLSRIAEGNPLAAEPEARRRIDRLQVKGAMSRAEAELISNAIEIAAEKPAKRDSSRKVGKTPGPEAVRGSIDFVGIAFLVRGRRAADAVGRVAFLNEAPQGTGFLVGPRLFLTNHHVIDSAAAARQFQVQFDYERDRTGHPTDAAAFLFDPEYCFVTDSVEGLDYTLIGVGDRRYGPRGLVEFGYLPLSKTGDKHMLGEIANVIQHPDGRFKELVLRENHLVARDETQQVLHYVADTEQGSSGSPVFNNEWEPIALHHWGGPWREIMDTAGQPLSREINEGIRISAIVTDLDRRLDTMDAASAGAVRNVLDEWDEASRQRLQPERSGIDFLVDRTAQPNGPALGSRSGGPQTRVNPDGSITWTVPVEIHVPAPRFAFSGAAPAPGNVTAAVPRQRNAEAASWETEDFTDRGGYESGFVPGFSLPLPSLDRAPGRAALNLLATGNDDPHELRYHHFSIVMNAERRLPYFTAVNIDGSRIKAVNRQKKTVTDDPSLTELGVESIGEGAEASDDFRPDRRISLEEQMNKPFYDKQKVAGFPDASSKDRIARMFQKGHIVLRGDPAWGTETEALAAEHDTFFYTNAAPQLGFFNQGSELDRPGSKGKLRWRAVETYVLRNAVTMRQRVSVFAGPIFADDDPPYRFDSRVPMRFWKIAAWNDGGSLRSIALLADQKPLIEIMPEAIAEGAEAFGDELELARVSEFLSGVTEIELLTGLDFGNLLRDADIRAGHESAKKPAQTLEPKDLFGTKRLRTRARSAKRASAKPRK